MRPATLDHGWAAGPLPQSTPSPGQPRNGDCEAHLDALHERCDEIREMPPNGMGISQQTYVATNCACRAGNDKQPGLEAVL